MSALITVRNGGRSPILGKQRGGLRDAAEGCRVLHFLRRAQMRLGKSDLENVIRIYDSRSRHQCIRPLSAHLRFVEGFRAAATLRTCKPSLSPSITQELRNGKKTSSSRDLAIHIQTYEKTGRATGAKDATPPKARANKKTRSIASY